MNDAPDKFTAPPPEIAHDAAIEAMLRQHLSARLDAQAGTARRRFEQALAAGPVMRIHEEDALVPRRAVSEAPAADAWNWRWSLGALLAAAACVAFAIGLWYGADDAGSGREIVERQNSDGMRPETAEPGGLIPLAYDEVWQSHDLGTYVLEGKPVRGVRHQQMERARFRDPDGYEVQIEVPREDLVFVDAPIQ